MSDTGQDTPVGLEQEPAARSDEDRELAERLAAEASERGLDLVGPEGVLTGLTKRVLEAGLEAELTEHLGYDKRGREPRRRQLPQRHKAEDGADRGRSREVGRAAGSGLELVYAAGFIDAIVVKIGDGSPPTGPPDRPAVVRRRTWLGRTSQLGWHGQAQMEKNSAASSGGTWVGGLVWPG
jgi:hypothetical protein